MSLICDACRHELETIHPDGRVVGWWCRECYNEREKSNNNQDEKPDNISEVETDPET